MAVGYWDGSMTARSGEEPMTFASRPPTPTTDLAAIAELSARSEAIDQLDAHSSEQALAGIFTQPNVDPQKDLRLWLDDQGRTVAFAMLSPIATEDLLDGFLWMPILPELRDSALAVEVVGWASERLRQLGAEQGHTTRLLADANVADSSRIGLLQTHGFVPVRYYLRMERSLGEPMEPSQFPAGFILRAVAGEHEAEAWVELFNQSFVDHWNFHPLTAERLRGIWADALYRSDLDLVVVAPDGSLAAFCACDIDPADVDGAGWITALGTRRGYRNQGLGRAALLAGLAALRDAKARVARLTVDAESLTGATRLYEAAGFMETRRSVRLAQPAQEPEHR
jgi:ribosomal protein S18 acetylase RimI-like enzyme